MRALVWTNAVVAAAVLSAAVAVAAAPPTTDDDVAPRPVTKRWFRELVRGEHPLRGVIDPATGVVAVDWPGDEWERVQPGRVRHLCGDELGTGLPPLMFSLQRELGWGSRTGGLTCTNRPRPSCTVGETEVFRVDFRHDDGGGLEIEAIVRLSGYRALAPAALAERERFAAAHVAMARRRSCPAYVPSPPIVVTKRLLRELGWGLRPMADVVDPRRGVVRASWPNSGAEVDHTPPPRHLCGADPDLEALRRGLLQVAGHEEEGYLVCKNRPVHECAGSELVDEYSNHDHLVFVEDPVRGLVLESWIDLDEGLSSDEAKQRQRRWAERLVADAHAHPCPP